MSCVIFFAAIARGYTGFGLSAIVLTIATYWIPAKELVPLLISLEITASLFFVRHLRGQTDWQSIAIIFFGAAISTPVALQLLIKLPSDITHVVVAGLALLATVTLLTRSSLSVRPTNITWLITGVVMGIFGGLGSIGGLAGMVVLLSTAIAPDKTRATMIVLLLLTSAYALIFTFLNGLMTDLVAQRWLMMLIPLMAGLYLGHKLFQYYGKSFRKAALLLLIVLSATMLIQSTWQII